MTEVTIPQASANRLRAAYAQFEQLAQVVAEALDLDPRTPRRLDLERGVFTLDEPSPNGQVREQEEVGDPVS